MFDYSSKKISVEEALALVESGFNITVGLGGNEPQAFLGQLHTIADRVDDVTITNCMPTAKGEYLTETYINKAFLIDSWFITPTLRKLADTGRVSFIPNHLHLAASKRNFHKKTNIMICAASMPEESGRIRFGCSNTYEEEIAKKADIVILEISPNVPHVFGDNYLEWDDIDYVIECDYSLGTIPDVESNEKDMKIGELIANLVQDGDCVQVGIGGIPNAVCNFLKAKRNLGIHTEMMTTGIMELMRIGVVDGSKKQVDVGKVVCAFALGNQEMYDFMNDNPDILIKNGALVNDPYVIARNDNQVSINTTVEIDLTGQCCSESIGPVQISGTGGQADTAIGAQISKNGRSIIALYSTTAIKDAETGERKTVSKIVPTLRPGAAVSLSRNDVDWVVTEYGAVNLRGVTVREKAERLISIAHPDFRETLLEEAKTLKYLK
ncbi:MAG: 4-hydroxybutyrate--acetyl-CoA CoA transferase [Clostridiales Family XIII bacterium]|jgi:acyl-CoA hydrolase|nr:4-hydroxybutyrate--acetyl-CoA CoA transferase [Clostridiales Family XIII bacterium]